MIAFRTDNFPYSQILLGSTAAKVYTTVETMSFRRERSREKANIMDDPFTPPVDADGEGSTWRKQLSPMTTRLPLSTAGDHRGGDEQDYSRARSYPTKEHYSRAEGSAQRGKVSASDEYRSQSGVRKDRLHHGRQHDQTHSPRRHSSPYPGSSRSSHDPVEEHSSWREPRSSSSSSRYGSEDTRGSTADSE